MRRIINTRGLETVGSCTEIDYNTKIASNIRLFLLVQANLPALYFHLLPPPLHCR
ncbi:hypothetical protein BACCELL_03816 [Bacteroides cellulosilyticus DSM 14838]|uniref:Uncharacterized protein n=1 Tax=Bacteroides cellulosilyticus DSM 14838 TaxID=537012 RepID=E2NHN8_9BACE|nr:hypothetical protein BACCELL_03816 [Bacteroides cellulosilyticus DSM 14838]